jgi:hypothetical protein
MIRRIVGIDDSVKGLRVLVLVTTMPDDLGMTRCAPSRWARLTREANEVQAVTDPMSVVLVDVRGLCDARLMKPDHVHPNVIGQLQLAEVTAVTLTSARGYRSAPHRASLTLVRERGWRLATRRTTRREAAAGRCEESPTDSLQLGRPRCPTPHHGRRAPLARNVA